MERRTKGLTSWGVVALAAALPTTMVAACSTGSDTATSSETGASGTSTASTPTSASSSASSSSAATTVVGTKGTLPVYWLGDTKRSTFLYREFVPNSSSDDPITAALSYMMSKTPADPDYRTMWKSPSRLTVRRANDGITVDVSADALSGKSFGTRQAQRSIQQLVWTATAAAKSQVPVTILVDGKKGFKAWNTVTLGAPMKRVATARAPIWIDSPTQGAVVKAGNVVIKGSANVFEGNVVIEITDAAGKNIAQTTGSAAMGTYQPFTAKVNLKKPGKYTLTAYEPDVSGGEGGEGPKVFPVTTTFTVK